ncbi:unnamed protein product [Trichobilharzia regenti]|nr:unnamed protein product [Trichobilharzia regenti]
MKSNNNNNNSVDKVSQNRAEKRRTKIIKSLDSRNPSFPSDPYRYVHNFSSVTLDKLQLEALSLGPRFCDQRYKVNQLDIDIKFENLLLQTKDLIPTSDDEVARFKTILVDSCQQYKKSSHSSKRLLTKQDHEALRKLRNSENIIISRPDKGDGVVLMNKCDYVDKINSLLTDETKFQELSNPRDLDGKVEKQLTKTLQELTKSGVISEAAYNRLKSTENNTSRLYGLPKVHKPGLPLRPVLDMFNSTYQSG